MWPRDTFHGCYLIGLLLHRQYRQDNGLPFANAGSWVPRQSVRRTMATPPTFYVRPTGWRFICKLEVIGLADQTSIDTDDFSSAANVPSLEDRKL